MQRVLQSNCFWITWALRFWFLSIHQLHFTFICFHRRVTEKKSNLFYEIIFFVLWAEKQFELILVTHKSMIVFRTMPVTWHNLEVTGLRYSTVYFNRNRWKLTDRKLASLHTSSIHAFEIKSRDHCTPQRFFSQLNLNEERAKSPFDRQILLFFLTSQLSQNLHLESFLRIFICTDLEITKSVAFQAFSSTARFHRFWFG